MTTRVFGFIRVVSRLRFFNYKMTRNDTKGTKQNTKQKHVTMEKENTENTEQSASQFPDPMIEELRAEKERLREDGRMRIAIYEIEAELAKAGARSPKLLFEVAKDSLQFSDDGKIENSAAIVQHLKEQFPEQFSTDRPSESIDGGAGKTGGPTLSKESLARMTPAEIAKLDWVEVRQVLAEHGSCWR